MKTYGKDWFIDTGRPCMGRLLKGMKYYPLFLDLQQYACLVVGAGQVGKRKIQVLLECSPRSLLIIDPVLPSPDDCKLWGQEIVQYEQRMFEPTDLEDMDLVFACTSNRKVNQAISHACGEKKILCNVADAPEEGNFHVPALLRKNRLCLTISTSGASPALARALKNDLDQWLDTGYTQFVDLLEKLRPHVLALDLGAEYNGGLFRALCATPLRQKLVQALGHNDRARSLALLQETLPTALHSCLVEILHEMD